MAVSGAAKNFRRSMQFLPQKCTQTTYTSFYAESQLLGAKTSASRNQFDIPKQTNFWVYKGYFLRKTKFGLKKVLNNFYCKRTITFGLLWISQVWIY